MDWRSLRRVRQNNSFKLFVIGFASGFITHFFCVLVVSPVTDDTLGYNSIHAVNQPQGMAPSIPDVTVKKDRILCWVMTSPQTHTRAHLIKETWGKRCDKLVFTSSAEDQTIPTVGLDIKEDVYDNLWGKFKSAIKYMYDHHLDDAEWFYKSDDDAFLIIENLRLLLSRFNSSEPLHMGFKFKDEGIQEGFLSGGPGYILTREAIRRFVEHFYLDELKMMANHSANYNQTEIDPTSSLLCQPGLEGLDDYEFGSCLVKLNVSIPDSRDPLGRERFLPFSLEDEICGHVKYPYPTPYYLRNWAYYPLKEDMECCSQYPVGFHYVKDYQLKVYEYLLYHLKVYDPSLPVVW